MNLQKTSLILFVFLTTYSFSKLFSQDKAALPDNPLLYSFYLVGDAGDDTVNSLPVLQNVHAQLENSDQENSGIIFLGDNIYPKGLHKKKSKHRDEDELRIDAQLNIVKDYDGDIFFIPGNHDWKRWEDGGLKAIKRQERYIEEFLDDDDIFYPENGCPGPDAIELTPGLVMIIIDTQWWLHQYERSSGNKDDCACRNEEELLILFKDLLKKYRHQNIIVAGHHPMYSNGNHGGHFTLKDHFFPLTHAGKNAYIPLPVIGSIYPFYRKFLGHSQDLAHPVYQDMINKLTKAMYEYDNIIYVTGHEHNLQFKQEETVHHIISGSGSKISDLKINKRIEFGAEEKGYARILYFDNGEIWVDFYTVDQATKTETLAFRKQLFQRDVIRNTEPERVTKKSYQGMTARVVPDSSFEASGFKRFFFGDLNREIWTTPLEVPYLDIHYEKGGLTPLKKGGGQQTISLRIEGADGHQYTLRGIKKSSMFLIERNLRGTIAQDILYDGMAGSHPYASVAIPKLADAAGVYHPTPKLVYVPKDSVLGDYLEEFGGMFCLFEERPHKDMSDYESFGESEKVINYTDAIKNMQEHYDHVVDVDYLLKARLLDMAIADWDRHDDQWRWGTYKKKGTVYYRPIPRDRDQAFFKFDGVFMTIANRKWLLRKFQPFEDDIRDIAGTNFNARYFDRAFLVEASKKDWVKQAEKLQAKLTDEVIEEAIQDLPPEGFEINGEEIITTLKKRRDKLPEFAERYYYILAKTVSVPGTLKDDYFEIIREDDGSVEVNIYPREKDKKVKKERYFHRKFRADETEEIRLYGLDGNDEYKIEGKTNKSIQVRIIAGTEKDRIEDDSKVRGLKKHTKVYDTEGFKKIETGPETKVYKVDETEAYDYDRKDFIYNNLMPLASVGYNGNDGFYIGPGFQYTAHGFKKEPYKMYHKVLTNYSTELNGFNFYYTYDFVDVIGKTDLSGNLRINLPQTYQYYGDDFDSDIDEDDEKYNVLMNDYLYFFNFKFSSKDHASNLKLGATFEYVEFEKVPGDIVIDDWEIESRGLFAPALEYQYKNFDSKVNPNRGIHFLTQGRWNRSLSDNQIDYFYLRTELSLFIPINITPKQTTLGLRSGYSGNFGDYAFYQANYADGDRNFRGVKRNRFSGKSYFFQNADLRFSLFKVPNYIVPFDVGVLGHYDLVRLWQKGGGSSAWNNSYGFGAFITILDSFMLQGTYSISERDQLLSIGSKFLF